MANFESVEFDSTQGAAVQVAVREAQTKKENTLEAANKALETLEASKNAPPEPAKTEAPPLILGKFKDQAALEAAYKSLESKLGAPKSEPTKAPPEASKAPEAVKAPEADPNAQAKETLQEVGLNFDEFSNEYAEKGALSDASYEKLAKANIPRKVAEAYIEGQKAQAELANVRLMTESGFGSNDKHAEAVQWAVANNWDGIEAYNEAVGTKSTAAVTLALKTLKNAFDASMSDGPALVQGGPSRGDADVYASRAEITKDMRTKEYKSDPAFRAKVEAKIARSDFNLI